MKYLILISSLLFCSCIAKVKIIRCIDGDTAITESGEHIRLAEIDAVEISQPGGIEAKDFLSNLVLYKTVELKRQGSDKYGRTIGKLWLNGLYINEYMVIKGEAWAYRYHGKIYSEQLTAKSKRIGLWQNDNAIPPFIWRKTHKNF